MAICPACGQEGSTKFCTNCGTPMPLDPVTTPEEPASAAEPIGVEAIPVEEPGSAEFSQEDTASFGQSFSDPLGQDAAAGAAAAVGAAASAAAGSSHESQQANSYQSGSYQAQPAGGYSSQGALGQAVNDVFHGEGWFPKVALLSLINIVPILNFVVNGYALRWGRRAAFRTGDSMPKEIFGDCAFETGFYAFVVMLCWGLVLGIIGNVIPLVGVIFELLAMPFAIAAVAYMGMTQTLGAGFRLPNLWEKGKRNYGGLIAIAYLPGLAASVVIMLIVVLVLFALGMDAAFVSMVTNSSSVASASLGIGTILAFIVCVYLMSACMTLACLVEYRAMGYWVARVAPEWVSESVSLGADPR